MSTLKERCRRRPPFGKSAFDECCRRRRSFYHGCRCRQYFDQKLSRSTVLLPKAVDVRRQCIYQGCRRRQCFDHMLSTSTVPLPTTVDVDSASTNDCRRWQCLYQRLSMSTVPLPTTVDVDSASTNDCRRRQCFDQRVVDVDRVDQSTEISVSSVSYLKKPCWESVSQVGRWLVLEKYIH